MASTDTDIQTQLSSLQTKQGFLEKELSKHKESIQKLAQTMAPPMAEAEKSQARSKTDTLGETALTAKLTPVPVSSKNPAARSKKAKQVVMPNKAQKKDLRMSEMDFGKVWFVRLGIISLITGLVFLSNFAYQNYIYNWGPAPRLAGLYLLSILLLGVGTYFEKAKAALSNYGRVLAAGGIATLYYASYAAHHIDRLRVVDSPLLAGVILLASAGACLGYALWKNSTTTALCSILLAFYSTSINPVGGFTLVSGLILTFTGMLLLDKLRQASIGFTTMLGAYISFIYWQLLVNQGSNYEHASWFVLGYWILCTAVIFKQSNLSKPFFSKPQLLTYTAVNNSLFILLTSIHFPTLSFPSSVWLSIATIGATFIGLSLIAQRRKALPPAVAHLYLAKGFALITLALCIKLSGSSLALSLTVQAGLAIIIGILKQRRLLLTAGYLALLLGFIIYAIHFQQIASISHLVMLLLYFGISECIHFKGTALMEKGSQIIKDLSATVSFFAMISLVGWLISLDLTVFSKSVLIFMVFAGLRWLQITSLYRYISRPFHQFTHLLALVGLALTLQMLIFTMPLYQAGIITVLLFGIAGIQVLTKLRSSDEPKGYQFNAFYNAMATMMLMITLSIYDEINPSILVLSLLPMAYHGLYRYAKIPSIPVIGFLCYFIAWALSLSGYSTRLSDISYSSPSALTQLLCAVVPLAHYYGMKFRVFPPLKGFTLIRTSLVIPGLLITASATLISVWQIHEIDIWELTVALTAFGFYLLENKKSFLIFSLSSLALYLVAFVSAILLERESYLICYIVLTIPIAIYYYNRFNPRRACREEINRAIAVGFSLALWFITSQHTISLVGSSALSICWALIGLAVLCLGFSTKDIVFRTMAFIVLGATILHVYGVDVWKLSALLRIISFITLGVVLLIVGYLYCKKVDNQAADDQLAE